MSSEFSKYCKVCLVQRAFETLAGRYLEFFYTNSHVFCLTTVLVSLQLSRLVCWPSAMGAMMCPMQLDRLPPFFRCTKWGMLDPPWPFVGCTTRKISSALCGLNVRYLTFFLWTHDFDVNCAAPLILILGGVGISAGLALFGKPVMETVVCSIRHGRGFSFCIEGDVVKYRRLVLT